MTKSAFRLVTMLGGVLYVTVSAFAFTSEPCQGVRLEIAADRASLRVGETPAIAARVVNESTAPVVLVQPGDGSSIGWRTPVLKWSAIRADVPSARHPTTPPSRPAARSGNINALTGNEVFTLAPGMAQPLVDWLAAPSFPVPGVYRLVLYYRNDPELVWQGLPLGSHDTAAMEQLKRSTKCSLVSNELEFHVRGR